MGLLVKLRGTSAVRLLRASVVPALLLGLAIGLPGSVSGHAHCTVEVTPRAAPGGSAFGFKGTGFTPNTVELKKADGTATVHQLDLGDQDPWEFVVHSRTADVGLWTAVFAASDSCRVEIGFHVTLRNTDGLATEPATQAGGVSLAAWTFTLLVGLSGGLLLGIRVRSANRA